MKSTTLKLIVFCLLAIGCSQGAKKSSNIVGETVSDPMLYFGQELPTKTPKIFAPGIISKSDRHEFGCTLSKDGTEFYFGVDNNGKMEIHGTQLIDGKWTTQVNLFPIDSASYNDPMFSPDEKQLYFISNRPYKSGERLKDVDIWYINRTADGWSDPKSAGEVINSSLNEYFVSFSSNRTMYFSSRDISANAPRYAYDIYQSKLQNGKYLEPEKLSDAINTHRYEADVFISPDESYIIFASIRKNGMGRGDLYISFKDANDKWKPAVNMVNEISTENHELCPFVSPDGKFFFYTSNQDIYWVSTEIFDDYK
ncbi:MAG: hypothetical protein P1U56_06745 [Saprospiraceae bacterium]|nr:hypothetical protein [Saprospiraceae bacterium]